MDNPARIDRLKGNRAAYLRQHRLERRAAGLGNRDRKENTNGVGVATAKSASQQLQGKSRAS